MNLLVLNKKRFFYCVSINRMFFAAYKCVDDFKHIPLADPPAKNSVYQLSAFMFIFLENEPNLEPKFSKENQTYIEMCFCTYWGFFRFRFFSVPAKKFSQ